jgi:hypothetical protein
MLHHYYVQNFVLNEKLSQDLFFLDIDALDIQNCPFYHRLLLIHIAGKITFLSIFEFQNNIYFTVKY